MKKSLLGSTAIVGASLLLAAPAVAQGPEVSLNGYIKFEVWFDDQDTAFDDAQDYHFEVDDAEVRFVAKATADNGLTYGLKLEIDVDAGTVTDEARLQFSGAWGTLQLGDEDGAEDAMIYGGESVLSGQGGFDGGLGSSGFDFLGVPFASPDIIGNTGDATKVSYFTPRFGGLQLGVSYTPDSGHSLSSSKDDDDEDQDVDLEGTAHVLSSSADITDELTSSSYDPTSSNTEDSVELGANFVRSFNGFDIALAGVVVWADAEDEEVFSVHTIDGSVHTVSVEDVFSWAAGGTLGFGGFSVGGGYGDSGDSLSLSHEPTSGVDADGEFWDVAAGYSSGPFSVSVGYFESESEGWLWKSGQTDGGPHDDDAFWYSHESEVEILSVGGAWTLAPGLKVYAEWDSIDVERTYTFRAGGGSGTDMPSDEEHDGDVFMIGAQVTF